jgi:hypothetical protein
MIRALRNRRKTTRGFVLGGPGKSGLTDFGNRNTILRLYGTELGCGCTDTSM